MGKQSSYFKGIATIPRRTTDVFKLPQLLVSCSCASPGGTGHCCPLTHECVDVRKFSSKAVLCFISAPCHATCTFTLPRESLLRFFAHFAP